MPGHGEITVKDYKECVREVIEIVSYKQYYDAKSVALIKKL